MNEVTRIEGENAPEQSGITRANVNDLMPEQTGILSTARHPVTNGPSIAKDDALVTIEGGMQVTMKQAARMGLLTRDSQGNYTEPTGTEAKPAGEGLEAAAEEAPEGLPFAPAHEALVAHLNAQVPPALQQSAMEQLISGGIEALDLRGKGSTDAQSQEFHQGIAAAYALFQAQGKTYMESKGVRADELGAWAKRVQPEAMKEAMRQHGVTRNPAAYDSLIRQYLLDSSPSQAALAHGGFQTSTQRDGEEMVHIPGVGMTTVKAAARAGLI